MAVAEDWLKEMGIKQLWTRPCQPKDKPFIERFIGTFQRECLDLNYRPMTVEEMQKVADDWLKVYENYRPHDSLGGLTPNEFYNKIIKYKQNIKENSKMY